MCHSGKSRGGEQTCAALFDHLAGAHQGTDLQKLSTKTSVAERDARRQAAIWRFIRNPCFSFPAKQPFIRKLSVELTITNAPIGILTLKNRTLSHAAQLFVDCAREVAKPLAKRKG